MAAKTDIQATRSDAAAGATAIIAPPVRLRGIIIASNNKNLHKELCLEIKNVIRANNILPLDFN